MDPENHGAEQVKVSATVMVWTNTSFGDEKVLGPEKRSLKASVVEQDLEDGCLSPAACFQGH